MKIYQYKGHVCYFYKPQHSHSYVIASHPDSGRHPLWNLLRRDGEWHSLYWLDYEAIWNTRQDAVAFIERLICEEEAIEEECELLAEVE